MNILIYFLLALSVFSTQSFAQPYLGKIENIRKKFLTSRQTTLKELEFANPWVCDFYTLDHHDQFKLAFDAYPDGSAEVFKGALSEDDGWTWIPELEFNSSSSSGFIINTNKKVYFRVDKDDQLLLLKMIDLNNQQMPKTIGYGECTGEDILESISTHFPYTYELENRKPQPNRNIIMNLSSGKDS